MKKFYLLSLLALGMIASCQKVENFSEVTELGASHTIEATFGDVADTRTEAEAEVVDGVITGYKTIWTANDEISMFQIGMHSKYKLVSGAGTTNGIFGNIGYVEGGITNGTANGFVSPMVGIYPYAEETTVAEVGDDYVINTTIPTTQIYAEDSFGQGAATMVGVSTNGQNVMFRNIGTALAIQLTGDVTITSATLTSKSHKIAGNVTATAEAANNWIPVLNSAEASTVELLCGNGGVKLSTESATKFFFVLAPGTYEKNDLTLTFTDTEGNYSEFAIPAALTLERSEIKALAAKKYEATGSKPIDLILWAKAKAYMDGDRIVPSLNGTNFIEWITNLANSEEPLAKIEEAIAYLGLKNYNAAYEVLGGVPGFERQVERFEGLGESWLRVDYTGKDFLVSMLKDIEKIKDIPSFLNYLREFEKVYEGSGLANKMSEQIFNMETLVNDYFDDLFFLANYLGNSVDKPTYADPLEGYRAEVREGLENFIADSQSQIASYEDLRSSAEAYNAYTSIGRRAKEKVIEYADKKIDEVQEKQLKPAQTLLENLNNLSKEEIEEGLGQFEVVNIDLGWIESALNTIGIKVSIPALKYNPVTIASDAQKAWDDVLADNEEIKELYEESVKAAAEAAEAAKPVMKAAIATGFDELKGVNLIDKLQETVDNPNTVTARFLNYIFTNEEFLELLRSTLHTFVTEIENQSQSDIIAGNLTLKEAAIAATRLNAIIEARGFAIDKVNANFAKTNEEEINNLYDGPWGLLKSILTWEKAVDVFVKLDIMDVYGALMDLFDAVEEMITYDKVNYDLGTYFYEIEEIEDYQQGIDWDVMPLSESI